MRTIVAGGRDYDLTTQDFEILKRSKITEVLCGGASGADAHGAKFAKDNNIPVRTFRANWNEYGKAAGPIRNQKMVRVADQLIAFWDGKSRGTADVIRRAKTQGIKVRVVRTDLNSKQRETMILLQKESIQNAPAVVRTWLMQVCGLACQQTCADAHAACDTSTDVSKDPAQEDEGTEPVKKTAKNKPKGKNTNKETAAPTDPPEFEGAETPEAKRAIVKKHIVAWLEAGNEREDLREILKSFDVGHLKDLSDEDLPRMLAKVAVA